MTVRDVWFGTSAAAGIARAALTPLSWLYGAGASLHARTFALPGRITEPPVPVLSLGNLSVGGTGKTPMAAWAAAALRRAGGHPAIVMRGYGDDEPLVHQRLNPEVPVIVDADRVAGAAQAHAAGADCVILDDGFQHRRIARTSDWVLVAAEDWRANLQVLPAGPLREPASALSRADVVVVTRKSASRDRAEEVARQLACSFPDTGIAICAFVLDAVVDARTAEHVPITWLEGRRVAACAAVGAPDAFFAQLRSLGAVIDAFAFRDHHAFDAHDVAMLVTAAERNDGLVCTLKDAVKLAPLWPRAAAPLWYVSQSAVIERGGEVLEHALATLLAARQLVTSTAGPAGTSSPAHGYRSSTAD